MNLSPSPSSSSFDIICITAPSNDICRVYNERCNVLKSSLLCLKDCKIYCIPDPKGYRIGSGGATLNVLSYLNENNEDLRISKVLIIHSGGNSQRAFIHSVCGKAWAGLNGLICLGLDNNEKETLATPMALLIKELILFSVNIPAGSCVVACSDVTLDILVQNQCPRFLDGCTVITVRELPQTAKNHGVIVEGTIVADEEQLKTCNVALYLQKPSIDCMKEYDAIDSSSSSLIDTGVVIFVGSGMQALIQLLDNDIILKCTEKLINPQEVLRLELYSDILQAFRLSTGSLTKEQYYTSLGIIENKENKSLYEKAIDVIWENLHNVNLYSINVKGGSFSHLGTIEEQLNLMSVSANTLQQHDDKLIKFTNKYSLKAVVSTRLPEINGIKGVICNSFLGGQCLQTSDIYSLIEHSLVSSSLQVGSKAVVSHLMITDKNVIIKDGSMIQQIPLKTKIVDQFVFVMFHWKDDIKIQFNQPNARIFLNTWEQFFEITSTTCDDIWDSDLKDKSLWTARLFPISTSTDMIQLTLWLQDLHEFNESMIVVLNEWRQAKRMSMLEIMTEGDSSSMHLWQRYLTLITKYKYSNTEIHDTLIDTYNHCKKTISRIMDIHNNMLYACPTLLLMLCCRIISNENDPNKINDNLFTAVHDLCHKFPNTNDDISNVVRSSIYFFDDFWRKISVSSNTCRLVLEYLESLVDEKFKVMVASCLLYYSQQNISKEFHARVVFMIGWLIRNNNIKFDAFTLRQSLINDIFSIIKHGLDDIRIPSPSSSSCLIESLAQSIVYCQIQSSLDMRRLSFRREGMTTVTKDIILTTAPVRIDLAGGWSDTPPICYEQGGSVLNVAVQVDNQRPVRCLSRAIHGVFQIKLHALKRTESKTIGGDSITCTKFKDFLNVSDTSLSTSLLKAALIVLEILDTTQIEYYRNVDDELDTKMFSKSLEEKFNAGIEICCISDLPSGSGMGGSSVIAAVIIRSISDLLELRVTEENLVYLVTQVEQVLSSGGGYQDQIGSIFPGFKICRSVQKLPLEINTQELPVTASFKKLFEKRCYLIYTGHQRLAKNILINALRNFSLTSYPMEGGQVYSNYNTISSLIKGAEQGAKVLMSHYNISDNINDDDCIDALAAILDNYFKLKVEMAPGTDPEHIRKLLTFLRPSCLGLSLCGAGGGGFAVCILKSTCTKNDLILAINEFNAINQLSLTIHDVKVDLDGIKSITLDSSLHANLQDYIYII